MDELTLVYQPEDRLFTGRVLYGDAASGERGAATLSTFERVTFATMFARLAEQVSSFVEKGEAIEVAVRRTDLGQPARRLDEKTVFMLHADPVSLIRSLSPSPTRVFAHRADPATTSPLRIGYDAIAATFGDDVYVRRRADQAECPTCGRWTLLREISTGNTVTHCRSMGCAVRYPVVLRTDRWVSLPVTALLAAVGIDRFFFPREWNNPGPWVTREVLEQKHKDWVAIKKELA